MPRGSLPRLPHAHPRPRVPTSGGWRALRRGRHAADPGHSMWYAPKGPRVASKPTRPIARKFSRITERVAPAHRLRPARSQTAVSLSSPVRSTSQEHAYPEGTRTPSLWDGRAGGRHRCSPASDNPMGSSNACSWRAEPPMPPGSQASPSSSASCSGPREPEPSAWPSRPLVARPASSEASRSPSTSTSPTWQDCPVRSSPGPPGQLSAWLSRSWPCVWL